MQNVSGCWATWIGSTGAIKTSSTYFGKVWEPRYHLMLWLSQYGAAHTPCRSLMSSEPPTSECMALILSCFCRLVAVTSDLWALFPHFLHFPTIRPEHKEKKNSISTTVYFCSFRRSPWAQSTSWCIYRVWWRSTHDGRIIFSCRS